MRSRTKRAEEPRGSSEDGEALVLRVRGEVVQGRLDEVRPNSWNFNEMTPRETASLREGLRTEGWLIAFALLVWGLDERGVRRNIILDGEHRWMEATALGFVFGPMVFLDDITEEEARTWTVKLAERRGRSNDDRLGVLLRGLPANLLDATSLGLDDGRLRELTSLDLPKPKTRGAKEVVDLDAVRPHPQNYKGHPADQLEHLVASLREFGPWRDLVLARDGTILAGHGLYEAAKIAGYFRLSAVRYPLDPASPLALKIVAIDNEVGKFAETDDRKMTELLRSIKDDESVGLLGTGFDGLMLASLVMVTRPASEIRGTDEAAAWAGAGMPEYTPETNTSGDFRLVVTFVDEATRAAFVAEHAMVIHKTLKGAGGVLTTYWPPRPMDDVASLRFKEGGTPPEAPGRRRRVPANAEGSNGG